MWMNSSKNDCKCSCEIYCNRSWLKQRDFFTIERIKDKYWEKSCLLSFWQNMTHLKLILKMLLLLAVPLFYTLWSITDSISPATGSWDETLLLLQHLMWMCSSVSRISLPMSLGQVEIRNAPNAVQGCTRHPSTHQLHCSHYTAAAQLFL